MVKSESDNVMIVVMTRNTNNRSTRTTKLTIFKDIFWIELGSKD